MESRRGTEVRLYRRKQKKRSSFALDRAHQRRCNSMDELTPTSSRLKKAGNGLDRKILSDIASNDPRVRRSRRLGKERARSPKKARATA